MTKKNMQYGTKKIKDVHFGSKNVVKLYYGKKLVWEKDVKPEIPEDLTTNALEDG